MLSRSYRHPGIVVNARGIDPLLRLFADVRAGEGARLLALASNAFLILTAYYVMKPVREVLILDQPGGAELKSYAYGMQAVLLVAVLPVYSRLATMLPRRRLINVVTAFFIACLPIFYLLAEAKAPIALVFFLWIGIFSLMVVAQFWAYANDVYTPDEGKRLFAFIAFGASAGAVAGAWLSGELIALLNVNALLLAAATILALSLLLFNAIDRAPFDRSVIRQAATDVSIGAGDAFALLLKSRYLVVMALVILLLNWVNSAGEYILSAIVKHSADAAVHAGTISSDDEGRYIGAFFADYFQVVNVVGMLLQLLVVARVVRWVGVPASVCILPVVALVSYTCAALLPTLAMVRWIKTAENSVDYSLMNTVRQMLFLPTTREEKFKAKQVIDSFIVRVGDVLSAITVYVGTALLSLTVAQFAWINVGLAVIWIALSIIIGLEFRRRVSAQAGASA
jgi:ATP:ADP antiporter, AAA family